MPEMPELKLSEDVRDRVDRILVRRNQDAVAGASQRDDDLALFDDQLYGRMVPTNQPWPGSAILNDPLTMEAFLQLVALFMEALSREVPWTVEAVNSADADKATLQEEFLTDIFARDNLVDIAYGISYNAAGRDDTAILYVGWQQRIRPVRTKMYRDVDQDEDDDTLLHPDERNPDALYDEVMTQTDEVEHEGCEYRVVPLSDFYLYDPTAKTIAGAQGCCERMFLTEDQLLDGVEDNGWDEDKVMELIKAGPTTSLSMNNDYRDRQNTYDGITSNVSEPSDGLYEVFLWFGRLPKLRDSDGVSDLPEMYHSEDAMAMICPDRNIVFHLTLSPYKDRPYIPFSMLPKADRFLGTGGCRLLAPLQDEANALLQTLLDSINIKMVPAFKTSLDWLANYGDRFQFGPGANIPVENDNDFVPIEAGGDVGLGLEVQGEIVNRGKGMVAAQGYGELQHKVRKNGEMQNVLQAADSKFSFFLSNLVRGWKELGCRILSLYQQFATEGSEWSFSRHGEAKTISTEDLRGQFRVSATATANTATPEMRLAIQQHKIQAAVQYYQLIQQVPPQFAPLVWNAFRKLFLDLGERNPEEYIGPEPVPQAQGALNVPAIVQALVAQGMPEQQALAIVQQQNGVQNPQMGGQVPQGVPPGLPVPAQQPQLPPGGMG